MHEQPAEIQPFPAFVAEIAVNLFPWALRRWAMAVMSATPLT